MTGANRGFIDVDALQRELAAGGDVVERIAAFYGRPLPTLHHTQNETRLGCILSCGKEHETGDRALSVQTGSDGALWRCFNYGCTVRGNLLHLMHWMKHNRGPSGGRLQGAEFKEIAADLQSIVRGDAASLLQTEQRDRKEPTPDAPAPSNIPLKYAENERARALVHLDEQFVTDVAAMSPKASAYVRSRPYMTPELMRKFRCGYLPQDAGSLLRGHFVYGWPDKDGNILTWFGRNLQYEEQHVKWRRSGDSSNEPSKFRFVKGFQRGSELYGENVLRAEAGELTKEIGIIVAEGPNDVINLNFLGVPAVAVCSNGVTDAQADKLVDLAREFGRGTVSVMFDLDREGEKGAQETVLELARSCRVRFAWTADTSNGNSRPRQPESLNEETWRTLMKPRLLDGDRTQ